MKRVPACATALFASFCAAISIGSTTALFAAGPAPRLLNEPVDVSPDFRDFSHSYYLADRLAEFDPATHSGKISYQRSEYFTRQAFDNMLAILRPVEPNEFPGNEYETNPAQPFSIEFVTPKTMRIRVTTGPQFAKRAESLMLAGPVAKDDSWKHSKIEGGHRYTSQFGSVTILENPWHIEIRDAQGRLDWSNLDLVVFAKDASSAKGFVCLPSDNVLREVTLNKSGNTFSLASDPLAEKVKWTVKTQGAR